MHTAVASLLAMTLLAQTPASNLDFGQGSLTGWDGKGFAFVPHDSTRPAGAWSKEEGTGKGMLRHVFTVPRDARLLRFQAYAEVTGAANPDARLAVVLAGSDNKPLPCLLLSSTGNWVPGPNLQMPWLGKPRSYAWDVSAHPGELMQVVLVDQDDRPGHYVFAGDFRFTTVASTPAKETDPDFASFMLDLQRRHQLVPMAKYDSKRFTAISNADERFSSERLQLCEIFYDFFIAHFRAKGFAVSTPADRLMIAVFNNHEGFDAYFGHKMPTGIAGVFHTPTNRLVLYDFAENRGVVATKEAYRRQIERIGDRLQQSKASDTVERKIGDFARDANLSTTMHECAHLLSFNCGLLNRKGDTPAWLAEGLATYCEATDQGDWTVLGAVNPMRLNHLHKAHGHLMSLPELLRGDGWVGSREVLLGYAQSWLLFHLLMTEKPRELRTYLELVRERRAPEQRLADFQQAFGNIAAMEVRYQSYLRDMLAVRGPTALR